MTEEQRRQLQQQLWNIANTLRGKMNADEFRGYMLGLICYQHLSGYGSTKSSYLQSQLPVMTPNQLQ
jgi:type I restriction-modification system DNA methylase subunit